MDSVMAMIVQYGWAVVFGAVFAEQIGLPFPSEPVLIAAGALIGTGRLHPAVIVIAGGAASLIGDTVWYGSAAPVGRAYWAGSARCRWSRPRACAGPS